MPMKLYLLLFFFAFLLHDFANGQNLNSATKKVKIIPTIGLRYRTMPHDWEELKRFFKPLDYPTSSNWSYRQPGYIFDDNIRGFSLSPGVTFHFNKRYAIEYIAHLRYDVTHSVNDWDNWLSSSRKKIIVKSFLHDHEFQFTKTFKNQKNRIGLGVSITNTFKEITVYYPFSKEHTDLQHIGYTALYQRKIYKNFNTEIKITYIPRGFPNHPLLKVVHFSTRVFYVFKKSKITEL